LFDFRTSLAPGVEVQGTVGKSAAKWKPAGCLHPLRKATRAFGTGDNPAPPLSVRASFSVPLSRCSSVRWLHFGEDRTTTDHHERKSVRIRQIMLAPTAKIGISIARPTAP